MNSSPQVLAEPGLPGTDIAIIGMAGRFPGAPDLASYWRLIRDGAEALTPLSDATLRAQGVSDTQLADPDFVKAGLPLAGVDRFDAALFGYSPREAALLDPQQRLFLECAWEALEHAGHHGEQRAAAVGVYAGEGPNLYLMRHLLPGAGLAPGAGISDLLGLMSGNSSGSLCTRVAYKLDLRGPAVSVQTECSTSLVAVHMACQALLSQECDMALAGGVWLNLLAEGGYQHQPGAILSPDGHCRAFDAQAAGTVIGSGAGIVVLKRLAEALHDGDTVHAVIKATAVNNDGADKVGFTAPSIAGQAAVIQAALALADVPPRSIGYVEAHGTGTVLGDPIEVAALTEAFRAGSTGTADTGFCALGSAKTQIGHLDAAAGVAGLIRATLALQHATLPPSLHFTQPNPRIDFARSPFYVNTQARPWPAGATPRRAGVSSFGIGGTNAHVVLEEAPAVVIESADDAWQVLPLSAQSATAVRLAGLRLATELQQAPGLALADVAFTLQTGRRAFAQRGAVVARELAQAAAGWAAPQVQIRTASEQPPEVVFLFPGGGSQHARMGEALYREDAAFRADIDASCAVLQPELGLDLRTLLFPAAGQEAEANRRLARMDIAQPALFVIDHALAQWWLRRGVRPATMLGHSLGEYVAACVAGVFERDDALRLVAARGRLLHSLPPGAMSAVALAPEALAPLLQGSGCDLAAVNAEQVCVFSGPQAAVTALAERLVALGHSPRPLHVAVASHSAMTDPLLPALQALVAAVPRRAPRRPFISNVTGQAITAEQAQDPAYWAAHLRGTVRFADGLSEALRVPGRVLLEVGPGETLAALSRQHPQAESAAAIVASQAHAQQPERHAQQLAQALATLWTGSVAIDWQAHHAGHSRRRVPLPGYAFQRRRHWVERSSGAVATAPAEVFHGPAWSRLPRPDAVRQVDWVLVLAELHCSLATAIFEQARQQGRAALWAQPGASFQRHGPQQWRLPFDSREALARLLAEAIAAHGPAGQVLHLAILGTIPAGGEEDWLSCHYAGLLALAQALDAAEPGTAPRRLALTLVGQGMEDLTGSETLCPERSMLQGLAKVLGQESPGLQVRVLDLLPPSPESAAERQLAAAVLAEALSADTASPLALRGPHRWHKTWAPLALTPAARPRLRPQGVYLITGGLGGVGLALAQHLAQHWQARLVLLGRSALPPRAQWPAMAADAAQPVPLRERLAALLALEAAGAQVLTLAVDVADAAAVRQALAQARQHFGALHGVVHAAGDAGGGMIAHRSLAQAQAVWAAKRLGSRALLAALDEAPAAQAPDFVLLCSSIASLAGGLGMSDYAAANLYLDALATARHRDGGYPVISVNWDAWRELGMARGLVLPEGLGMTGPEGARAFERIVNGPAVPQVVVVATTDLARRLGPLDGSLLAGLDEAEAPAAAPSQERHARPALATPFAAPASALEQALAAAWSERLGLAPIGLHDNFFELGGDSLVAIQLLSRLRKSHGLALHPSEFFKAPTVAALAARMAEQATGPVASQRIASVPRGGHLPLSPMQRRLWLVDRLGGADDALGRAAYNMSAALAWHGALDEGVLAQAIEAIVARHEALRSVFIEDADGTPVAEVKAALQIPLPLTDLSALPEALREARFQAAFDAFIREPFALDQGPLLQAALVRLAPQHHVLMLSVHHIVFDGWSIAVFAHELGRHCEALLARRPAALPPLALQYADYAAWYAASLAGPEGQASAPFWRTALAGAPTLSALPADHARPARASHAGAAVSLRLDAGLADGLQRLARAQEASLFQLLLAAFLALAHRACGQEDLVVGTDVAGRRHPDLEPLIGFFVNVVPLRSRLPAAAASGQAWPSFAEWLQASQRAALQALDHQATPFDEIVELAGVPRQRDRNPLVQMLFVLQNTPEVRFELPGARIEVLPQQLNESKFDLAVFVRQDGGALQVDWVYATSLYQRDTVARHAQAWQQLLQAVVQQPDRPLHTLMPSPERPPMTAVCSSPTPMPPRKLDTSAKLAALQSLKGPRPAAPVPLVGGALQARPLQPGRNFPLVLQAQQPGLDLAAWARGHVEEIEALLARHGGLLFRNTSLHTPQDFERFAEAIEPELYGSYGDLPKKEGGRKTYRSTPYPEDEMILFHNESAHLDRWPRKQWFFCELPSPVGGATPIVDGREMLRRLPAELVAEFERRELLYVRTFVPGLDVPWREFFKTDERAAVEARLAAGGITWRWLGGDTLQTCSRGPAVIVHPVTGERVFFNQVQLHHTSCLAPEVRADLLDSVGTERMPRQVLFGDGTPIPDAAMAIIGQAYEACAVRFDWCQGDVVMLDNMLAAHARDPYQGPRKIVVAMGAMFERAALAPLPAVAQGEG